MRFIYVKFSANKKNKKHKEVHPKLHSNVKFGACAEQDGSYAFDNTNYIGFLGLP